MIKINLNLFRDNCWYPCGVQILVERIRVLFYWRLKMILPRRGYCLPFYSIFINFQVDFQLVTSKVQHNFQDHPKNRYIVSMQQALSCKGQVNNYSLDKITKAWGSEFPLLCTNLYTIPSGRFVSNVTFPPPSTLIHPYAWLISLWSDFTANWLWIHRSTHQHTQY